ncbi:ribonuclease H-like domain-containing protein [Clostridium akagii]|uniref:ribonuclease H-like domain-containing protein n=1 Tax=Clostridium akagii TaxID=91623 RepID=UPI001FA756E8|nr:ribonuclease H-like domain-containing protein [Clostridium akagii]
MIIRNNIIPATSIDLDYVLIKDDNNLLYEDALFFDLEHYVYKKPICIGVFGCCYYDKIDASIHVTQYMIENKKDAGEIMYMVEDYFQEQRKKFHKKYIVTFSGNNDFTVLRYLYNKIGMEYNIEEAFGQIDLQKEYEKVKKVGIGLKNLEKIFDIDRESELISGSNLAKTINKIMNSESYFERMPEEKKNKILLYNEQDVVSLFHMVTNWKKYMKEEKEEEKEEKEEKKEEKINLKICD